MSGKAVVKGRNTLLTEAHILDAKRVFKALDQSSARHLKRFSEGDISIGEERSYLNRLWNSRTDKLYLIEHHPPHAYPIGSVGLHEIDWSNGSARVAMLIFRKANRGLVYESEALDLVQEIAFDHLGLHRIYACLLAENSTGTRLLQKLGYLVEGYLHEAYARAGVRHDVILFSLLKKDRSY